MEVVYQHFELLRVVRHPSDVITSALDLVMAGVFRYDNAAMRGRLGVQIRAPSLRHKCQKWTGPGGEMDASLNNTLLSSFNFILL